MLEVELTRLLVNGIDDYGANPNFTRHAKDPEQSIFQQGLTKTHSLYRRVDR